MIKIKNLTKIYKGKKAVDNIDLHIKEGETFGFIGPNGAGKSTTIRCILKLINKNQGEIFVNGQNIGRSEEYKEEIGYLPSDVNLYQNFKVSEIFKYATKLYKKDCEKRLKHLVEKLEIDTTKKISELSYGNLKKVGIVIALMHEPKIIILDEPTSGLDPLKQKEFFEILKEEKEKGTTIFFSSHNLEEVKKISDRVGIIKDGKIVEIKTKEELTNYEYMIITIKSEELINIDFEYTKKELIEKSNNVIKFIYKGNINELLKKLTNINIQMLSIESPSIEEIFMHYYEEEEND